MIGASDEAADGVHVRLATVDDVATVVELLAADMLGTNRETVGDELDPVYLTAFADILASPDNHLVVLEDDASGEILGTLQLTFIPYLSHRGTRRALIEAVRVRASHRGEGLGRVLMQWAIEQAKDEGCAMVQLTSNRVRSDAHRFYLSLGFEASHDGFKLHLG